MAQALGEPRQFNDQPSFEQVAGEYLELKKQIDALTARQKEIKPLLMDALEEAQADTDGHSLVEFSDPIAGYRGLQRQRRVSLTVDESAAVDIFTALGILERCMPPRPTLDEDEVMGCLYEGLLNEDDIEKVFPKKVTYALVPKK